MFRESCLTKTRFSPGGQVEDHHPVAGPRPVRGRCQAVRLTTSRWAVEKYGMREEDQAPGDPDPRVLGARLQEARKARRITQQQAAEALDLSRPTYIAIEKGTRPVQPGELIRLAELYGRGLHELLRQRPPVRDFVPHFRAAAGDAAAAGDELEQAIAEMERLCDDYLELEQICQSSLPRHYPPPYEVGGQDLQGAAEWVARQERNRLGLGDTPVPHLRELLETDVGLRIWYLSLPNRVSGLFVYTEELGGCIGVQRKHPPGRQLWSLAHEYAHFLGHRYQVEVTGFADSLRKSPKERFADGFAGEFLLPAPGLKRRFHDLLRSSGRITPAMLVELSSLYGVSFQALVLRLEGLRLLPVGTWGGLA
ncbi:MAG: ImmA/IrrE family metallo-endopeptidase, partial [Armatimonadetes bacterium]|nr:ImmA/IrrE family metallo-endopeptidase [Armatimonadota bacterium]